MTEKEKMYLEKFGKEYLNLRETLKIWVKPGYSTLSKLLSFIAYKKAIEKEIIINCKKNWKFLYV